MCSEQPVANEPSPEKFPLMMVGRFWCGICLRHRPIVYAVGAEVICFRCGARCYPHSEDDQRGP